MTFDDIETRAVAAIREADHFTASLFLGRGQYRVEKRPTVLAPDGFATLLTAALIEQLLSLKSKGSN